MNASFVYLYVSDTVGITCICNIENTRRLYVDAPCVVENTGVDRKNSTVAEKYSTGDENSRVSIKRA